MFGIITSILVVLVVAALFGWLAKRSLAARSKFVKAAGFILSSVLALLFLAIAVFAGIGTNKLFAKNSLALPDVTVQGTPDQVARGEHLARVLCSGCHSLSGDLPLSGGKNLSADAGMPLGDIYAPNLPPATDIKDWPDPALFRTIRTGLDDTGRATAMTAVAGVHALSDADTLAVIAYLRQAPAVVNATPEYKPTILMALFAGAGLIAMDIPAKIEPVIAPAQAPTAEYGQYVFSYMDCASCHGKNLDGVVPPPYPAGPDLRNYFAKWSKDDFIHVVQAFAASAQPSDVMPWKDIGQLDPVELEALYLYLHAATSK
jgi:mono/diheme cytochrome c family protein